MFSLLLLFNLLLCDFRSEDWDYVPDVIKEELELTSKDDGEFWMSFDDFRHQYCNMIICNLAPDFDHDGISDKAGENRLIFSL